MRPRALVALGGLAGGLLAVAEVGWLAAAAPETLVHGGGALLMLSVLLPRAVIAGAAYTTVQAALVRALGDLRDARAVPTLRHLRGRTSEPELLLVVDAALSALEPPDDQGT